MVWSSNVKTVIDYRDIRVFINEVGKDATITIQAQGMRLSDGG